MPPKPPERPRPTEAELEILSVLWSRGPSTVREVHDEVSRRKPTQYTTVLKFMQIMAEKGLVRRDERARAHVYRASRPQEWTQRQIAGDLLQRAFGGSAKSLVMGALAAQKASPGELAEIRKLLDGYEKGAKALGWTLFHFLWEGAAIADVLVLALALLKPASARLRYGAACAALPGMALAFGITLAVEWPWHAQRLTIATDLLAGGSM